MSVLFPLFLAGLAAVVLPWLLHRFNRVNPPITPFPSTQFLEATRVPVSRQKRIRHWLLFALRALLLAVLCLLFAQPHCSINPADANSDRSTFVVIDRSASMQANDRWEQAVAATAEALSNAQAASGSVQLFDFASNLTAHGELSNNTTQANAVLRNLSVSNAQADYGLIMQQLDAIAARQKNPVNVVMITDVQASNLPVQRRLLRSRNIQNLTLQSVATEAMNVAVRASATTPDDVNVSVTAQMQLSYASANANNPQNVELTIRIGDSVLKKAQFVLNAEEITTASFDKLILPSSVAEALEVSIVTQDGDALLLDNSVIVPIERLQPIPVGLVSLQGRLPEAPALFLRTALTTDNLARVVSRNGAGANLFNEAKNWIVFAAASAASANSSELELPAAVVEFVATGGNVMVVLQANDVASHGNLNAGDPTQSTEKPIAGDYVGTVDIAHPLALSELDWQAARVFSPVAFTPSSADRVLMRTGTGTPLIIERSLQPVPADENAPLSGRLLIITDPLDGIASDIPLQSAFVDWIAQTIRWFDASAAFPAQLDAGKSLHLPARSQVLSAEGRALQSLSDTAKSSQLVLNELGVHTVVTPVAEHKVAVVFPWQESSLQVISDELLVNWAEGVVPNTDENVATDVTSVPQSDSLANLSQARPWWPWLLPLLALALCAESLMANRKLAVRRDGL